MNEKLKLAIEYAKTLDTVMQANMPTTWGPRIPLPKAYEKAKADLAMFMDECASDPELRAHMTCWMVDFCGDAEPAWYGRAQVAIAKGANLDDLLSSEEMRQAINGEVDDLSRRVAAWLEAERAEVTDSGSGAGGWHLGARCTQAEFEALTVRARDTFAAEIATGALKLRVWFCGWHFRT